MADENGDVGIIEGEKLLITISDGESPEVFAHPCLVNTSRGVSFRSNLTETEVANCTDPSQPARIVRKVKSIDFDPSGAGKVDKTSVWFYIEWWKSGLPKNAIIEQNEATGSAGGWTGTGQLILETFSLKGDRGDYQEVDISWKPASTFEWEEKAG